MGRSEAGRSPGDEGRAFPGAPATDYWATAKYHAARAHATISYRVASGGVALVILLALVGAWLTNQTGPVDLDRFYTPLLAAIFVGAGTGHYAGLLLKRERAGEKRLSLLIGIYATLVAIALLHLRVSILSGILVTAFYLVFVVHTGGLVAEDGGVEHWVSLFAGSGSNYGLVALGILHYTVPVVTATTTVLEQVLEVVKALPL